MRPKQFFIRSTSGQPWRSTESMAWIVSEMWVMDHGYLGDVGKQSQNLGRARRVFAYSELGTAFVTDSRDWWWQLWPWIHEVCGLLYYEDEEALQGAVQYVSSPYIFNNDNDSSTQVAAYVDPRSMGMSFLWLAETEEQSLEKRLQLQLQLWRTVFNFDTDTDTDTNSDKYSTTWPSTMEQAAINTSTLFVERKSTPLWRTVSNFDIKHPPPCNSLCALALETYDDQQIHLVCRVEVNLARKKCIQFRHATGHQVLPISILTLTVTYTQLSKVPPRYNWQCALAFQRETMIFLVVCRAEVNIAMGNGLQFQQQQHNWRLGPRGCIQESMMLHLDCVSPLEERLTGSQDRGSREHNWLPSLGLGIWLTPSMAWVGEWSFGRSSGHGMVWLLSFGFCHRVVFSLFFNCLVFDGRDNALENY